MTKTTRGKVAGFVAFSMALFWGSLLRAFANQIARKTLEGPPRRRRPRRYDAHGD